MEEEEKIEGKKEDEVSLKHWISRIAMLSVIFVILIYLTQIYFNIQILSNSIITIAIVLFAGLAHEYLHYYKALKLGYEPKWYRTRFTMGFEISHKSARDKWIKDKKKISILPYIVILPVATIIAIYGLYINMWGIWFGGIMTIVFHGIAYPLTEGH